MPGRPAIRPSHDQGIRASRSSAITAAPADVHRPCRSRYCTASRHCCSVRPSDARSASCHAAVSVRGLIQRRAKATALVQNAQSPSYTKSPMTFARLRRRVSGLRSAESAQALRRSAEPAPGGGPRTPDNTVGTRSGPGRDALECGESTGHRLRQSQTHLDAVRVVHNRVANGLGQSGRCDERVL